MHRHRQVARRVTARSPRLRAVRSFAALLFVAPILGLAAGPVSGADTRAVHLLRTWHVFTSTPSLNSAVSTLDVKARVLFSFSQPGRGTAPLTVRAWHLDKMTPASPLFTGPLVTGVSPATPLAVDETNHVVVVAPAVADGSLPTAVVLALRDGQVKLLGTVTSRFAAGYQIAGISIDAVHGRALVIAAPGLSNTDQRRTISPAVGTTQVDSWRLGDLARGVLSSELTAPAPVPSACGQPMATNFPAAAIPSADGRDVYIGCVGNRGVVTTLGPNAGDVAGVGRFTVFPKTATDGNAFRLFPVPGNFTAGDSIAASGAGRLIISAPLPGLTNFKVFDVAHEHYVGNVGVDGLGLYGFATDAGSGRGYSIVSNGGMGVFELKPTPVTQGRILDDFRTRIGSGQQQILFDPKTRRLFVPSADDLVGGTDPYLLVFQDTTPPYDVDAVADPDAGALDVPEVPGKTDSDRAANIEAVGAEYRMVGGTSNLVLNLTHLDTHAMGKAGTRDLQLGVVRGVVLTNGQASATAVTSRFDDTTTSDAGTSAAPPATCNDFGETPGNVDVDSAGVSCDLAHQKVTGTSKASAPRVVLANEKTGKPAPEQVQVRSASSSVVTERLASGATKTTVISEADGVDLLGTVTIGRVLSTAVTETHGRRGSAHSTYTTTYTDVSIAGTSLCHLACSISTVNERINDALAGRANVAYPDIASLASPGGSNAQVSVDDYQHVEDTLVSEEAQDSVVAPAMVVTVYTDGTAQSRMLVRLAALATKQRYKIFDVSTGGSDQPGTGVVPPVVGGVPGVPGTPGSLQTTTVPGSGNTATPTTTGNTGNTGVIGGLINGLRVVFRSPGQIAGIACIWMLLALPAYLAARRRLLLELPNLRRVQEDV